MAIKVDRPAGGTGDDVVVFVARSLEEARAARDALVGAGVACDMPDAALEAIFAQGAASVQVRVKSREFSRAMDAIDARFPPPEPVDLPPEPPPPTAASAGHPAGGGSGGDDDDDADDEPSERALAESAAQAQGVRLQTTALKVGGIAIGGLLLPGIGAPFSLLAVVAAVWCLRRSSAFPDALAKVRTRAGVSLALGLAGLVWHGVFVATWWMGPSSGS